MSESIGISKLQHGYLVEDDQGNNVAALSTFADLVTWMAGEFDEALIGIETPDASIWRSHQTSSDGLADEPPTLEAIREQMQALVGGRAESQAVEATSQHSQAKASEDNDATEPPGAADCMAGDASRPSPGGGTRASIPPTTTPAPIVSPATEATVRASLDRVKPAERRPAPATEPDEDLTEIQQKVLDCLQLRQLSTPGEAFRMTRAQIADGAGINEQSVPYTVSALKARGLITVQNNGIGKPVYYTAPLPAEDEEDAA